MIIFKHKSLEEPSPSRYITKRFSSDQTRSTMQMILS